MTRRPGAGELVSVIAAILLGLVGLALLTWPGLCAAFPPVCNFPQGGRILGIVYLAVAIGQAVLAVRRARC